MKHARRFQTDQLAQLSPADQIDLVCDSFEAAWKRGESPQIEAYLGHCEIPNQGTLLAELILVDRELRTSRGESAGRDLYQNRFHDHRAVVDALEFDTAGNTDDAGTLQVHRQPTFSAGIKLSQFELLEELGSGASGTVWKARDTRLKRLVAIKIPRRDALPGLKQGQFLREAQACAQLRHPEIVAVYEVGEENGCTFIVSEFVAGKTLREWLRMRKPTPREAAELAAVIAAAVQHAHKCGIIHRDLKPANVLIDSEERPHITDFGLAKWIGDKSRFSVEGTVLGTPAYMSPEQARGNTTLVDQRSDVYGLGALLYELLSGRPPFEGDVPTVVHHVIHDEPASPRKIAPSVPRDLETICLKAMQKAPEGRYQSAHEMELDLRRFLHQEPIHARRVGAAEQSWRWISRRKALTGMLGATALAAGAVSWAGMLARRNRSLLGIQTISLAVEPPGADVYFVPLDKTTSEPQSKSTIRAAKRTPIVEELMPGDYLVVAVLGERFHEVWRRVPKGPQEVPLAYPHRRWRFAPDGTLVLPHIKIPELKITNYMHRISSRHGSKAATVSGTLSGDGDILVDAERYTVGQFRKLNPDTIFTSEWYRDREDHEILPVTFDDAVGIAEMEGKRLPTSQEYDSMFDSLASSPRGELEEAATLQRGLRFPMTDLLRGVGEWTLTPVLSDATPGAKSSTIDGLADFRVIRGGLEEVVMAPKPMQINLTVDEAAQLSIVRGRIEFHPNLGFRCVRSSRPPYIGALL